MNFQNRREKEARGCLQDWDRCHIIYRSPGSGGGGLNGAGAPKETNRQYSIDVAVLSKKAESIWERRSQVERGFMPLRLLSSMARDLQEGLREPRQDQTPQRVCDSRFPWWRSSFAGTQWDLQKSRL